MPAQPNAPRPPEETPLQGWKEIAAYIERNQRTARRWEAEEGLPIRRHRTDRRSSVYAYPSEIDQWRSSRAPASAQAPSGSRQWLWPALAALAVLGAFGLLLRSPGLDPIAEADAKGIRTVELCADCDWLGGVSPDGRYLSETDWVGSGDIGIRDLQTGEYRRLGDKPNWEAEPTGEADRSLFSPDGRQIAYSWSVQHEGENGYELRVIDAFSKDPHWRSIYHNPEARYVDPAAWTLDDRLLVRIQYRDWSVALGFVDLSTGALEVVRSLDRNASRPILSPDARWIAYDIPAEEESDAHDIFLLASDGSQAKQLTRHRANDVVLGFTPDSEGVLFGSNRTGSYGLWSLSLAGGDPKILMRDLGWISPLGVLSDGSLVYARALGNQDIYRAEFELDTGELIAEQQLVDTLYQGANSGPWLSPDGSNLAYFAATRASIYARGSSPKLMVHNLDSGNDLHIPTEGLSLYPFWDLDWSPDGTRLVFPARNEKARWGYYEASAETRTTHKLLDIESPQPIFYAKDGNTLLFPKRDSREGERVDVLMTFQRGSARLKPVYLSRAGWMARMAMSPQRDRIAWLDERKRVLVMPVGGGEPRTVFEDPIERHAGIQDVSWSPSGEVLLLRMVGAETWVAPLNGGEPHKTELTAVGVSQISPHPDGKTVFYQAGSSDTRIFKTEHYLPAKDGSTE